VTFPSLRPARLKRLALPAVLLMATGVVTAAADAHDRSSERRLFRAESAMLGSAHAAEHARLRRYQRSPRWRRAMRQVHATARAAAVAEPLDGAGRWTEQFDIPVFAINAILLPTGKVLWFAYPNNPDRPGGPRDEANAWLWDPSRGTGAAAFKQVDPPIDPATGKPVNIWCAGNSLLADGRVLVTGGNLKYPTVPPASAYKGLDHVYTFDPFTETWTRQPDMQDGRWYPSQLLMPDGRTLIMSGLDSSGQGSKNADLELFTPSASMNGVGSVTYFGDQPSVGDYYPHLFWMPSGRALIAGPFTNDSWWLNPPGNPPTLSWSNVTAFSQDRVWGTAVLVPGGPDGSHEVVQLGGTDRPLGDAVASAELFDERTNAWVPKTSGEFAMKHPRGHHNTVLLPDGTMVTIGGGWGTRSVGPNGAPNQWAASSFHLTTELWDPATRTWRLGPPQREYRTYHSTAVLLPDGRVVSAGDDYNGRFGDSRDFTQDSAEIYEPPYLFDGDQPAPRPAVTAAPGLMTWGGTYQIGVARAPGTTRNVTRAVLVAPSATTHAVDMNQRYVPLEVTGASADALTVRAPATPNIALPGWYMLFVLDDNGTPSTAAWVRMGDPPPPPAVSPGPTVSERPALPKTRARLVRRDGRRLVLLKVGASDSRGARVRLRMLDRRKKVRKRATVMVRTGRTTLLRGLPVPRRVRSVKAVVGAVGALPGASGRLTPAGARVRVAGTAGRRAAVRVRLTGNGGRGLVRRIAIVPTGRSVLLRRLRVPRGARAVEVTLEAGLGTPR
jgi:hypothetical protein